MTESFSEPFCSPVNRWGNKLFVFLVCSSVVNDRHLIHAQIDKQPGIMKLDFFNRFPNRFLTASEVSPVIFLCVISLKRNDAQFSETWESQQSYARKKKVKLRKTSKSVNYSPKKSKCEARSQLLCHWLMQQRTKINR